MSKRIMNEVMCSAEDIGVELYYQDTDSIHIKDCDIKRLADAFQEKYGRVLIGKAMGQFHSDFKVKGGKNPVAERSCFLGKKAYCDELVAEGPNGEKVVAYHSRLKGIPDGCLQYTWKQLGYANPFEMFKAMYDGKAIEFDLTQNKKKVNFKVNKDYSVKTLDEFKRVVSF
jgi:hypothetical protein